MGIRRLSRAPAIPARACRRTLERPRRASPAARYSLLLAIGVAGAAGGAKAASLSATSGNPSAEVTTTLDLHFRGLVAKGTARHVFVSDGEPDEPAVYTFSLPAGAAVTGMSIEPPDGEAAEAFAVDAKAAIRPVPRPEATDAEPDRGLLRMISRNDVEAVYELRLSPLPPGEPTQATVEFAAPLTMEDGRVSFRMPRRDESGVLAPEQVRWRIGAPPGASVTRAFANGRELDLPEPPARGGPGPAEVKPFAAPRGGGLSLVADLEFADEAPTARRGAKELEPGLWAVAGEAAYPLPDAEPDEPPARIMVLADISRSLGGFGARAAADLATDILASADGASADLVSADLIVFDRAAERVFERKRAGSQEAKHALRSALTPEHRRNGTDLAAALRAIRPALESETPPDLVVALSDDVWPTTQTADRAKAALGRTARSAAPFLSITVLPDEAPRPAERRGPLDALAHASGGAAMTIRHGEASGRGSELLSALTRPPPLRSGHFAEDRVRQESLALPRELPAGAAAFAAGFHHGEQAPELAFAADLSAQRIERDAEHSDALARLAFPLAALYAEPAELLPLAPGDDSALSPRERGLRRLFRAALREPVVTPHIALVIPADDEHGRARAEEARRFGSWLYRRMPAPGERDPIPRSGEFEGRDEQPTRAATGGEAEAIGGADIAEVLASSMARLRHCYRRQLRRDSEASGELTVVTEFARGEILAAHARDRSGLSSAIEPCAAEAVLRARVPRVRFGDEPEPVVRAAFRLRFRDGGVFAALRKIEHARPLGDP